MTNGETGSDGLPPRALTGSLAADRFRNPIAVMSRLYCAARIALSALGLSLASAAGAQSIPCGVPYTVQRGDTLQRIAERAYGPEASFRDLIPANRGAFTGGNPSLIEVGQVLTIPCRGDGGGNSAAAAPAEPQEPAAPVTPALLKVAGTDGTDAAARVAALADDAGIDTTATAADGVHPDELVTTLAAAGRPLVADALPRPACETVGLDTAARALCDRLVWSEPVAEYVLATFTLAQSGPVTRNEALHGRRLCLPAPAPLYLLAGRGLMPPAAELQQPATVEACLTALRAGGVDAVIAPAVLADEALAALGPGAAVTEQFALAQLVTLHSAALAEDGEARAALDRLGARIEAARREAAAGLGRLPD
jgi:polar amino acid transport system substrate-binding protein